MKKIKLNKKIVCIVSVTLIIAIFILLVIRFCIYPKILIKNVNEKYEQEQYDKVSKYYNKIKIIDSFVKNREERNILEYKIKYSTAFVLYNNSEYFDSLKIIESIVIPDDKSKYIENECNYNMALKHISENDFYTAVDYLLIVNDKSDKEELLDQCYYNISLELLNQKNFEGALSMVEKIKKIDIKEFKKQIYYEYGMSYYNLENYNLSINKFEKAKGYKDAETYYNNSCILNGEKLINSGNYSSALENFDKVPSDIDFNGMNIGKRKTQLANAIELEKNMGKKNAISTKLETKNVWKYDGRWDSWYVDKTSNEYIEIYLKLNDDGSFNISGKAMFYVYDDFSSLAKYVIPKSKISYFDFKNVYEIPSEVWLDTNTKFSYSNGIYRLDYYKEDNYSTNFYNIYQTTISY